MVLLLSDVGSRVAVVASRSRVQGILAGGGAGRHMELRFVNQNAPLEEGELLLTSGLDAAYPKGIPVARVLSVKSFPHTGSYGRTACSLWCIGRGAVV